MRRPSIPTLSRYPEYLENPYPFPDFYKIRLNFPGDSIPSPIQALERSLEDELSRLDLKAGSSVCIGVGSRGVNKIDEITRAVVRTLRGKNLKPFIIPAMGSHGGATGPGQKAILESFGVTETVCDCPIRSDLAVEKIGEVFGEVPVYYAKDAMEADYSICINRVKPHTKFKAPIESGILKMLAVGMGKHQGALAYHEWALKYGFYDTLKEIGDCVMGNSNFLFGVGVVENAGHDIARIEAIPKVSLIKRETELLKTAKALMPKLPTREVDALIINQVGKEISGAGMDPNITGRAADLMEDDFSRVFKATRLAILSLSPDSNGNALGIGNADIVSRRAIDAMDYEVTLMNILTSVSLRKAAIPVVMPNDEKTIQACLTTIGPVLPDQVRVIIIKNTYDISECWVSEGLYRELRERSDIETLEKTALEFDAKGNLNF